MTINGDVVCRELNLYDCIQCGRCTGGCPVSMRSRLNPRRLIYEALLGVKFVPSERTEIWECTSCATCIQRCPKKVRPMDLVIHLRSDIIESGRIRPAVRDALESTFLHGNPWGRAREKRTEWIGDEKVKILKEGESVDILYYVCCTAAYDTRVQEVARSIIKIMNRLNLDYAILGNEENCCSNEMNKMGEKGLFEISMEKNIELFSKYRFSKMVTTSPHCFHTFKNDYPEADYQLFHYTQFFSMLIDDGILKFSKELKSKITYHDPCFLGKQNKIFEEPRKILQSIPGVEYIEMDRSRERSLCCEGGGGRMWIESESQEERLAEIRVKDAVSSGAEILATACPFCLLTLEDAVKTTGNEEKIRVCDISEIIEEII